MENTFVIKRVPKMVERTTVSAPVRDPIKASNFADDRMSSSENTTKPYFSSINYPQYVTKLSNHLFDISAIQKNKMKKINIPQGTQLVEKGKDDVGNTIFMFHIHENGKLVSYTTTEIPKNTLYSFKTDL